VEPYSFAPARQPTTTSRARAISRERATDLRCLMSRWTILDYQTQGGQTPLGEPSTPCSWIMRLASAPFRGLSQSAQPMSAGGPLTRHISGVRGAGPPVRPRPSRVRRAAAVPARDASAAPQSVAAGAAGCARSRPARESRPQASTVAPIGRASAQRLEVIADDAAQHVPIRLARLVLERGAHGAETRKRRAEYPVLVNSTSDAVADRP
jgi:hypothetical protein